MHGPKTRLTSQGKHAHIRPSLKSLPTDVGYYKASLTKSFRQVSRIFHHLKNLCIFPLGQVAHYNKTTLKNHSYFHCLEKFTFFTTQKIFAFFTWAGHLLLEDHFENLCIFNLGRSPITMRPFKKNLCIFHLGRSPIIMRPFLKNLWIFHLTGCLL